MTKSPFPLLQGEQLLGTWTLNYTPPAKGKYLGTLAVTTTRVVFQAQFDIGAITKAVTGLAGTAAVAQALGMNNAYVKYHEKLVHIEIPRADIAKTEEKKKFLIHMIILTLKDGTVHTFDYGVLPVDKIMKALA